MACLRKRKTKNGFVYVVDFRYQGERHALSVKTSNRRMAEKVRSDIEAKIASGLFRLKEYEEKEIRLSDFLNVYFTGAQGLKLKSTLQVDGFRTKAFLRTVGDVPISSIRIETLEKWRAKRLEKVRPATFNGELRVLKTVFSKAVEYGYLQSSPFKKIKKVREEQKRLYMTSDEIRKMFDYLQHLTQNARNKNHRSVANKFMLFCEVLLGTGMRRSELINLTIDHVDFERNIVLLEKTKGKKRREIPMTSRVGDILGQLSPTLFGDMSKNLVTRRFTECAQKIGLQGMKLHSLRHTFGTYLIALGYDITVVKELLGHEDITTTMIYAKADASLLRDAIKSIGELGKNGYKMVTKTKEALEVQTHEKTTPTSLSEVSIYSARRGT